MKLPQGNSIEVEHIVWYEEAMSTSKNIPIDWEG